MPIEFLRKPWSEEESLSCLDEDIRRWFTKKFRSLTPPQRYSFKIISEGRNVVITAPTGSGKTFSAFMVILSELFRLSKEGKLEDKVYCLYVSPLRALDNDIYKNLMEPLSEITRDMKDLREIRIGIRTGDITPYEKQKQLRKPPHILITTPESLAIILNSRRFIEKMKGLRWVVVDEIHELASSKRGVHLSLSLERLQEMCEEKFIRIGLGATLHPLEEVAKFLVGFDGDEPRDCIIVDVTWFKPFDLEVRCPTDDIIYTDAEKLNDLMYKELENIIDEHHTTLIFTNTRSGTERVVYHLKRSGRFDESSIAAHHGSLSREIRWDVENRLKEGKLKAVVSSTSLELGIDIGYIDAVVQIGSPKSVSRCVQRIGRSGHGLEDVAKGIIIGMDRDDLIECGVMLKCILKRKLDRVYIPRNCIDVLSQHIVGMALNKKWDVRDAYRLIRRSYCYREFPYDKFISILHYLAGHYADLEDQSVYGKIWFDEREGVFGRRGKYTKVIYYLNMGTIPDEVKVDVYTINPRRYVGDIEEDFLERLRKGDIFILGGKTYEFRYARGMRCFVEEKKEEMPTIPAWFSELLPLSYDLAVEIGKFRERVENRLKRGERIDDIIDELPADGRAKKAIKDYFLAQYRYVGEIPTHRKILIEKTRDLRGRNLVVFHAIFGRRINDALSRIFAICLGKKLRTDVRITISDNGFSLMVSGDKNVDVDDLMREVTSVDIRKILSENIRRTELMKRRFRHCASRSFLILRNYKGHKISVRKQQVNAEKLMRICESIDPNFPIIEETYREILEDLMDVGGAEDIIKRIGKREIIYRVIETRVPSPFAHNLVVLGEADIVLMKDRRERLMELHERIMREIS
ncbi:MAG TPA: ATP-dependent helicase [Thermoplasmatales archaeon]|nr:ATP-dependent helicase [Thermoplasmatales archaeon]HEX17040.1 ATP-dependent helicase [Thermoplasmatales archaeon]